MRKKKELTEAEKRDLAMKYEVAEELGLLEKVERYKEQSNCGIQGYHSFLGGRRVRRLFLFIARKTAERKRTEADKADRVDT